MADETTPRAQSIENVEENGSQRQSDAAPDAVAEQHQGITESSDRAERGGSDANGVPAFDEADGETRKKLYKDGATLVSRMD